MRRESLIKWPGHLIERHRHPERLLLRERRHLLLLCKDVQISCYQVLSILTLTGRYRSELVDNYELAGLLPGPLFGLIYPFEFYCRDCIDRYPYLYYC